MVSISQLPISHPGLVTLSKSDQQRPWYGVSGEGSGHGLPLRHSIEAVNVDAKGGAF